MINGNGNRFYWDSRTILVISNVFWEVNHLKTMLKLSRNLRSEYFLVLSSNFAILPELCDFWRIMRKVAIGGQLCKIATSQNIRSPVLWIIITILHLPALKWMYMFLIQCKGHQIQALELLEVFPPRLLKMLFHPGKTIIKNWINR